VLLAAPAKDQRAIALSMAKFWFVSVYCPIQQSALQKEHSKPKFSPTKANYVFFYFTVQVH
jgi:exonuclease III